MRSDIKIELDQGLGSIELADSLGLSIYYAVQDMDVNEMREVSCCLADLYLTPDNVGRFRKIRHERYALVIRTIFGDLSRNGMILSDTHPSRENDIKRNESWVIIGKNLLSFVTYYNKSSNHETTYMEFCCYVKC